MPSTPPNPGRSRHYAGLLLRVVRPGGLVEEFYLAGGLTIGRSVANTVVLADDEAVDRTHARVEVDDVGRARLRCVEPDSSLNTEPGAVRELLLEAGSRFHIGRSAFECVPGRRVHADGMPWLGTACPFCGSTSVPTGGQGARSCPDCNSPVLPVRFELHDMDPLLLPVVYGDFQAERYVARGGMALVLGGVGVGGMPVAIKVFLAGAIADRRDTEVFDREVAMLARVRHPNVVKLLDHGQSGRIRFIILEWVDGPSLRQVIADANRAGRLVDFSAASRWFNEVGKGLAAIHAAGMVHRDIKPSNILVGNDGVARVADLGIASRVDADHTAYTTTWQAPGTFEYMAPEQVNAPDTVDGRSDLYAMGVTFHELLTGARPVGAWKPASEINHTVPRSFDVVVSRLLAPWPENRYRDILELLSVTPITMIVQTDSSAATLQDRGAFQELLQSPDDSGRQAMGQGEPIPPELIPANGPGDVAGLESANPANRRGIEGGQQHSRSVIWNNAAGRGKSLATLKEPTSPAKFSFFKQMIYFVIFYVISVFLKAYDPQTFGFLPFPREPARSTYITTKLKKRHLADLSRPTPVGSPQPERIASADPTPLTNSVGMKLMLIPAGEFQMGSDDADKAAFDDEKPRHRARITRPLYLGSTEVTQSQYRTVTGQNPSLFRGSDDLPVESVSWNDAIAFCNSLSEKEGLKPYYQFSEERSQSEGDGYRLPTEAEWEYACRAGATTSYHFGDDAGTLGEYDWYAGNRESKPRRVGETQPVGQKRPNKFGLFDIHGNVCEWCSDWYNETYYTHSTVDDPGGPSEAAYRVGRGGCWSGSTRGARSAFRSRFAPDDRLGKLGFRVARVRSSE